VLQHPCGDWAAPLGALVTLATATCVDETARRRARSKPQHPRGGVPKQRHQENQPQACFRRKITNATALRYMHVTQDMAECLGLRADRFESRLTQGEDNLVNDLVSGARNRMHASRPGESGPGDGQHPTHLSRFTHSSIIQSDTDHHDRVPAAAPPNMCSRTPTRHLRALAACFSVCSHCVMVQATIGPSCTTSPCLAASTTAA
jgi:hypothetical protein